MMAGLASALAACGKPANTVTGRLPESVTSSGANGTATGAPVGAASVSAAATATPQPSGTSPLAAQGFWLDADDICAGFSYIYIQPTTLTRFYPDGSEASTFGVTYTSATSTSFTMTEDGQSGPFASVEIIDPSHMQLTMSGLDETCVIARAPPPPLRIKRPG